jgi:hypothetical protein
LQLWMNIAVKIFEIFTAVSDHWPRKRRQGFPRNFNRSGREKLIVRLHQANVQRLTRLRKATPKVFASGAAWLALNVQFRL